MCRASEDAGRRRRRNTQYKIAILLNIGGSEGFRNLEDSQEIVLCIPLTLPRTVSDTLAKSSSAHQPRVL